MLKSFLVVSYEAVMQALFFLPRYPLFNAVKSWFLRLNGAKVGRRVIYYPRVWIENGRNLVIEDDVDLAIGVIIVTPGGVHIGSRALIGYGTQILSTNHVIPPRGQRIFDSGHRKAPIHIERDVWIGAHCVILPGVTIGEGAVVAAGSIVTRDVPQFSVVAGVPARVIRMRDEVDLGASGESEGRT